MKTAHRFALATAGATFVLLLLGGTVHPTGSSLACPDWPLCYGSVLYPSYETGVLIEHTHRLVATAVGVMTIVLLVLLRRAQPRDAALVRLGWLALGLVVVQGVWGGVTVLMRLSQLFSTLHLATSQVFFLLVGYIAWRTRPAGRPLPVPGLDRRLVTWAAVAVAVQMLLGALVRHANAAPVCGVEYPTCMGGLWWPPDGPRQLHMLHRHFAWVAWLLVFLASTNVWRRARAEGRAAVARAGAAALGLAIVQVMLGIMAVLSGIEPVISVLHLGVATLLLADLAALHVVLAPAVPAAVRAAAAVS